MEKSFHDKLVTARDRKHSKNHPFLELWSQGKLTKEQTAIYCLQHYHFVTEYLNWMAYEASQIPHRDVKAYLLENLGDEENPQDRHLDMLTDYVVASGLSKESIEKAVVLPGTEALQNWGWRLVYQSPWQVALAGMFIGLESQFLDICKKLFLPSTNIAVTRRAPAKSASLRSTSRRTRSTGPRVLPSWRNTAQRRSGSSRH